MINVFQFSSFSIEPGPELFSIWTNAPDFSFINRMFSPPLPITTPARLAGTGYSTVCCPTLNTTDETGENARGNISYSNMLMDWLACPWPCSASFCAAISLIFSCAAWQASCVPVITHPLVSRFGSSGLNWIRVPVSLCIREIFSPPRPITTPTAAFGTYVKDRVRTFTSEYRHNIHDGKINNISTSYGKLTDTSIVGLPIDAVPVLFPSFWAINPNTALFASSTFGTVLNDALLTYNLPDGLYR